LHTQSKFRVLVVRLSAMGDILHALPAVTALRLQHPLWEIGWVVEPRWAALLEAGTRDQGLGIRRPLVDQLHLAPTKAWGKQPFSGETLRQIGALRRELRAASYDVVLDLQGSVRSAVIARMSGCRRRIGSATPWEWPAKLLYTDLVTTRGAHVAGQNIELAAAIAADELEAIAPQLPVDTEAEAWCDAWLQHAFDGAATRTVVLLVPSAGWGAKCWPAERYRAVALGLKQRGFLVVVNAGPGEDKLAAAITEGGAAVAINTTLPQLIAFTRRIALAVGGDTGPIHMAAALGRPVVGIYGPTDPARNGPFGTRARILRRPGSKRDHKRRAAPDPGLLTIAPEDVLAAADELLSEEQR
jgi:heptosyltransferase-1